MKRLLFILLVAMAFSAGARDNIINRDTTYIVHSIDQDRFKEVIGDWDASDWNVVSPRPVVVDFYADWCGPCRRLAPILSDIAQYYEGEVDFYRINVDENPDIAAAFEVRSIPLLLICPLEGDPKAVVGLYSMSEYIRVINLALCR